MRFLLLSGLYDLIFCTETWLNETVSDDILCSSTDYNVFRNDRFDRVGGGVAIFCKNSLRVCKTEIMTVSELLICDLITTSKQKIRFILCYRPPQYDIELAEHMCCVMKLHLFLNYRIASF